MTADDTLRSRPEVVRDASDRPAPAGIGSPAGAGQPTPRPSVFEYAEMPVRITRDAVYIGDEQLPGCIIQDGITLKPGQAGFSQLTVTFFVGPVNVDDPCVTTTEEIPSATASPDPVTRYHSHAPRPDDEAPQRIKGVDVVSQKPSDTYL